MLFKPDNTLKKLYQQIADLSKTQCEKDCFKIRGNIGSCCSDMYCDFAIELAKENNLNLELTDHPNLPLMGESGCTAPPWVRPMCSLHICDKSLFDKEFNKAYFVLRDKIDTLENELYITQENKESLQ